MFQSYTPDVMVSDDVARFQQSGRSNIKQILNLGSSDNTSFTHHESEYQKTTSEMHRHFEDTYVSLIRAIRQLAYPKHPSVLHSERTGSADLIGANAPAAIPIFVMRPFRGQLEHATQSVVNRLRAEGDKAVFWLDTSGWLTEEVNIEDSQDFFLDDSASPSTWRLTEQGNQRVAIILHMHVCRYFATLEEHCAFLRPDTYQGKVFNPEETSFDRYLEDDKEKQLRELFFGPEGTAAGVLEDKTSEREDLALSMDGIAWTDNA